MLILRNSETDAGLEFVYEVESGRERAQADLKGVCWVCFVVHFGEEISHQKSVVCAHVWWDLFSLILASHAPSSCN